MAKTNPFATTPINPGTVQAPVAPVAVAPTNVETAPVEKKERKKREPGSTAPQLTSEDRMFILNNYATSSPVDIAHQLQATTGRKVTRQQVYRCVFDFRKAFQAKLDEAKANGNAEGVNKANALLEKVPSKPFGGGAGGRKGSAIDDLVNELLDF